MRALRIFGVVAVVGWGGLSTGCDSDDDAAPSPATAGAAGVTPNDDATPSPGAAGAAGVTPDDDATPSPGNAGAAGVTPYANVMSVVASGSEGAYTFSVSIESADIDCTQFANWWEVLTEDGTLSYRRILEHSHTDANGSSDADQPGNTFTRTGGPVPVAADAVVLVRAHMSTGGYNGQVMRGSAAEGFTQAPDIGGDFAAGAETDAPQPTGCDF